MPEGESFLHDTCIGRMSRQIGDEVEQGVIPNKKISTFIRNLIPRKIALIPKKIHPSVVETLHVTSLPNVYVSLNAGKNKCPYVDSTWALLRDTKSNINGLADSRPRSFHDGLRQRRMRVHGFDDLVISRL